MFKLVFHMLSQKICHSGSFFPCPREAVKGATVKGLIVVMASQNASLFDFSVPLERARESVSKSHPSSPLNWGNRLQGVL